MKHKNMNPLVALKACAVSIVLAMQTLSLAAKGELNLYIWSEYIDPDIITQFEEKNECKVIISLFESNEEMLAKLQAGGVSQYDIVVPSDFIMNSLIGLNLLQKLDSSKIPNLSNLGKTFKSPPFDQGNQYSAAYQWGTVGLVYNTRRFAEPVDSWEAVFKPAKGIKFMYFDSEREMIGAAMRYLGYSLNSMDKRELKAAADLMIKGKKNRGFMGFEANVGGLNKVIAETVDIAVAYNGDAIQATGEHDYIEFVNPKEGTVVWVDSMCVPARAPNPELAMAFINYILDPEVGAQLSNYNQFASPNEASLPMITPEDLENPAIYPDKETLEKLEYVLEMPQSGAIFGELWKMVKTR